MQALSVFFFIVSLAAALGVIKPYTGHLNRWQFAIVALLAVMISASLAPSNALGFGMVFLGVFFAAVLGVIKPFTERVNRWQFAVVAIISMFMVGATTDQTKLQKAQAAADKVADADASKTAAKALPVTKSTAAPKAEPSAKPRQTTATKPDNDPWADETKQGLWIVKSRDAIKSRIRDPGSADFRKVRFYSGGPVPVVCGEVNSKNGFGGYTGFQRFIASGDDPNIAFVASDVAVGDSINEAWDQLCVSAKRDKAYVP